MALTSSYAPNYFSVTDILASEERISCKIEVNLPRLGFLDVTSNDEDLKPGTKMELPFWLAQALHCRKHSIASVEIPKFYKEGYREILAADACAVTLSRWNPYYYELGMLVIQFNNSECEKIKESLLTTYKSRIRFVMDWAHNSYTDPILAAQLPALEKILFTVGRKSRLNLVAWLNQGSGNIEKSNLVANLMKKRKREEFESN